jgi:hypothetical protein
MPISNLEKETFEIQAKSKGTFITLVTENY